MPFARHVLARLPHISAARPVPVTRLPDQRRSADGWVRDGFDRERRHRRVRIGRRRVYRTRRKRKERTYQPGASDSFFHFDLRDARSGTSPARIIGLPGPCAVSILGSMPDILLVYITCADMDEARHLVIIERVAPNPRTGRKIWLERDL